MPNEIITPSLVARVGLATLYNTTVLAGLVWRDFDPDFSGKQGDTITIRKPAVFEAKEFNRATGIELQDIDEDGVPLKLDHLADVSFPVTAEELTLSIDDFSARLLTPAMEAIVQRSMRRSQRLPSMLPTTLTVAEPSRWTRRRRTP